jgi:hypothetical protein
MEVRLNPEHVHLCENEIEKIGNCMSRYISEGTKGQFQILDDIFLEIVTRLQNFIQTSSTFKDFLKSNPDFNSESPFLICQLELLTILNRLAQAKKRNDLILIMDILEYELFENLVRWKINVLDDIKN